MRLRYSHKMGTSIQLITTQNLDQILIAGIPARLKKPSNGNAERSISPKLKKAIIPTSLNTNVGVITRPYSRTFKASKSGSDVIGSLAHQTGQADIVFGTDGKTRVISATKYYSGGFATEGLFAFTRDTNESTWQADSHSVVNQALADGRLIRLGDGTQADVYGSKDGIAYKIGTGTPQELMRAVSLSKLGIGPKVFLEQSVWRPRPAGATQGFMVLATEKINGVKLEAFKGFGRQSNNEVMTQNLLKKIVISLAKYHALGWVHNDFSTKNIMIQRNEKAGGTRVMIIDNGQAQSISALIKRSENGVSPLEKDLGSVVAIIGGFFPNLTNQDRLKIIKQCFDVYLAEISLTASPALSLRIIKSVQAWEAKNFNNR
jgi:Lipopolysaccharide kinase (Kdo/WaaP) family